MTIAHELGKTLSEIEDMPSDELSDWFAFFTIRARAMKNNKG